MGAGAWYFWDEAWWCTWEGLMAILEGDDSILAFFHLVEGMPLTGAAAFHSLHSFLPSYPPFHNRI